MALIEVVAALVMLGVLQCGWLGTGWKWGYCPWSSSSPLAADGPGRSAAQRQTKWEGGIPPLVTAVVVVVSLRAWGIDGSNADACQRMKHSTAGSPPYPHRILQLVQESPSVSMEAKVVVLWCSPADVSEMSVDAGGWPVVAQSAEQSAADAQCPRNW